MGRTVFGSGDILMKIDMLKIRYQRLRTLLLRLNIKTVAGLLALDEDELLATRKNFGIKTYEELKKLKAAYIW